MRRVEESLVALASSVVLKRVGISIDSGGGVV